MSNYDQVVETTTQLVMMVEKHKKIDVERVVGCLNFFGLPEEKKVIATALVHKIISNLRDLNSLMPAEEE